MITTLWWNEILFLHYFHWKQSALYVHTCCSIYWMVWNCTLDSVDYYIQRQIREFVKGGRSLSFPSFPFLLSLSPPPNLHLTTSKVMVIVWRLRGNIIWTVLYIANVLPLQWAQLTKTVHTARLGLEFVFLCFLGCMICIYVDVCFFFTLDSWVISLHVLALA